VFDNSNDPWLTAFVLPNVNTVCQDCGHVVAYYTDKCPDCDSTAVKHEVTQPLSPRRMDLDGDGDIEPVAIRYWRVIRDPGQPSEGLYMLARTVVPDPWDTASDGLAQAISRTFPTYNAGSPRDYKDRVVALTPGGGDYNVSLADFSPTDIVSESLTPLQVGSDPPDYSVYISQYPLWQAGYQVKVYDNSGAEVTSNLRFTINPQMGAVSFARPITETITTDGSALAQCTFLDPDDGNTYPGSQVIPNSETVTVNGIPFTRVNEDPQGQQYQIDYAQGALQFDSGYANTDIKIRYSWRNNADDDRVVVDYATKSALNIRLTLGKRDKVGNKFQYFHVSSKVKLKNVPR